VKTVKTRLNAYIEKVHYISAKPEYVDALMGGYLPAAECILAADIPPFQRQC